MELPDERRGVAFLVAIAFGVTGGMLHVATSLATFTGNQKFKTTWFVWYLLRPLIAASLAVLVYVVFRAGFLPSAGSAADVNIFGVAAIAGLAGMFSKQVIDKLENVMDLVFASRGDRHRADKL